MVVGVAVPALGWLFAHVVKERMGTIILSAFVAHTAWHWFLDRGSTLMQYNIEFPAIDLAFVTSALRALLLLVLIIGAGWSMHLLAGRLGVRRSLVPEAPRTRASE